MTCPNPRPGSRRPRHRGRRKLGDLCEALWADMKPICKPLLAKALIDALRQLILYVIQSLN